ncbi:hypothetical protein YC2023_033375 [Brassica napus]
MNIKRCLYQFIHSFFFHSESVNGTNTGRKRLPEDKGPDVPADDSSSKDKAPEPNLQSAIIVLTAEQIESDVNALLSSKRTIIRRGRRSAS